MIEYYKDVDFHDVYAIVDDVKVLQLMVSKIKNCFNRDGAYGMQTVLIPKNNRFWSDFTEIYTVEEVRRWSASKFKIIPADIAVLLYPPIPENLLK